jgi:hypothetical protein
VKSFFYSGLTYFEIPGVNMTAQGVQPYLWQSKLVVVLQSTEKISLCFLTKVDERKHVINEI